MEVRFGSVGLWVGLGWVDESWPTDNFAVQTVSCCRCRRCWKCVANSST